MEHKVRKAHIFATRFFLVLLVFFIVGFSFIQASQKEICDGKDNDHDGLTDEGKILFTLNLSDAPSGPSITGLGWTDQCKESCQVGYCSAYNDDWLKGKGQPGHYFDSPYEGEAIAQLTLRTVGFSEESYRPGQNQEVVEAHINGVWFDKTEDNCNSLSCQCNIEEQTSSRKVNLTGKNNFIDVRMVKDSIGMKSADAVFYADLCQSEHLSLHIISPENNSVYADEIPIEISVDNKQRLEGLSYIISSKETHYNSGMQEDLIFNDKTQSFEKVLKTSEKKITESGTYLLQAKGEEKYSKHTVSDAASFCIDLSPPKQLENISFDVEKKAHDNTVTISWAKGVDEPSCSGISHYRILRNAKEIASTNKTSFIEEHLDEGAYNYTLISVDLAGHESKKTSTVVVITEDMKPTSTSRSHGSGSARKLYDCGTWSTCIDGFKERTCVNYFTDDEKIEKETCLPEFIPTQQNLSQEQEPKTVSFSKSEESFELGSIWWILLILIIILVILVLILFLRN